MLPRRALAAYYQHRAQTYAHHARLYRERYDAFARSPRFVRWLFGRRWQAVYLDTWDELSILSEAYALTARYLMGVQA